MPTGLTGQRTASTAACATCRAAELGQEVPCGLREEAAAGAEREKPGVRPQPGAQGYLSGVPTASQRAEAPELSQGSGHQPQTPSAQRGLAPSPHSQCRGEDPGVQPPGSHPLRAGESLSEPGWHSGWAWPPPETPGVCVCVGVGISSLACPLVSCWGENGLEQRGLCLPPSQTSPASALIGRFSKAGARIHRPSQGLALQVTICLPLPGAAPACSQPPATSSPGLPRPPAAAARRGATLRARQYRG